MFKVLIFASFALCISAQNFNLDVLGTFPLKKYTLDKPKSVLRAQNITYRLPKSAIPKKYELELIPDLEENSVDRFTFQGKVKIKFVANINTKNITLHAKNLKISANDVKIESFQKPFEIYFDEVRDFLIIKAGEGEEFQALQDYVLEISYIGELSNELRGFYRSSYLDDEGKEQYLATTHFEPTGARQAFPCFDEPAFKTPFKISIIHNSKFNAISNMKGTTEKYGYSRNKTTFDETPAMSTYLVAFVVSDFKALSNNFFKVYARPNAYQNGELALNMGEKLLKKLDEFTSIPFSTYISKMDQIAIPDFSAGAMENWGLVTYREASLLYNENSTTLAGKQNIVETIAHEFAHQWFGNLVSPKWWKYTWLNEGFASFFQTFITQQVLPEWRSVDQQVIKSTQASAFLMDSSAYSHPMNNELEKPYEIIRAFDGIAYQKGGSVIRMMQHFLGEDVFQSGLRTYLLKNARSTADSDELFRAISTAIPEDMSLPSDLTTIMNTWVDQPGYPVINVTRNYDSKNNTANIVIQQERYVTYNASEQDRNYTWFVPINYATAKTLNFSYTKPENWLSKSSMNLTVNLDPEDWIIFNKQQAGYYRVNYDEKNWKLIIKSLNSNENREKIHVLNRAQLLNDALSFTQNEALDLGILLNMTVHLKNETDYVAWYPGFRVLSWLRGKLINTKYDSFFREYTINATKNLINSTEYKEASDEKLLTNLNHITAFNWACTLGQAKCLNESHQMLLQWLNGTHVSPNFKPFALCHGMRVASMDTWKLVLDKYNRTTENEMKSSLENLLSCSSDRTILDHYFNYTLKEDSLIKDTLTTMRRILQNSAIGVDATLDYLNDRFIPILISSKNVEDVSDFIQELGPKITTEEQYKKLQKIKLLEIPTSVTNQGLQSAANNLEWFRKHDDTIDKWVKSLTNDAPSTQATFSFLNFISIAFIHIKYLIN